MIHSASPRDAHCLFGTQITLVDTAMRPLLTRERRYRREGVSTGGLAITSHLIATCTTLPCETCKATGFLRLVLPGDSRRSSATSPGRPGWAPRVFLRYSNRRSAPLREWRRWCSSTHPPQPTTPPGQPAAHCAAHTAYLHTLGQVGEQYGPSTAPFGHARC